MYSSVSLLRPGGGSQYAFQFIPGLYLSASDAAHRILSVYPTACRSLYPTVYPNAVILLNVSVSSCLGVYCAECQTKHRFIKGNQVGVRPVLAWKGWLERFTLVGFCNWAKGYPWLIGFPWWFG